MLIGTVFLFWDFDNRKTVKDFLARELIDMSVQGIFVGLENWNQTKIPKFLRGWP